MNPTPEEIHPNADDPQVSENSEDEEDEEIQESEPEGERKECAPAFHTKEEASKRSEAADSLALVIAEQLAAKNRELAALADEATLGFVAFPLIDLLAGMGWGRFNRRDVSKPESRKLQGSMEINGLNNSDPMTVIHIGVRKQWIQGKLTKKLWGKSVLELALWKLTPEGVQAVKEGEAIPFSGNHRRDALINYQRTLERRVRNVEAELKHVVPKAGE